MGANSMFRRLALGALLVLALAEWGCRQEPAPLVCEDALGCVRVGPGEPLKFGVLQALSGKVAPLGVEQVRGIELALAGWNRELLGHPVVLQIEDDGCTAEGGANAALRVIADPQIVAILGSTCSGAAVTASAAMSRAGLTMISGNNSAPYLTSIAGQPAPHHQPGYFRTAPNEEMSGEAAARFAHEKLGIRRAATIHDGDIYTRGLTEGFERAFRQAGGEIVLSSSVDKGDMEMGPVLAAVLQAQAELLFFPLFQPEGNHILLQARETPGFESMVLMSDGALIEASFLQAVGEKGRGMYFVGPSRPVGPAVDALAREYVAAFHSLPSAVYYQSAYDSLNLLFTAIEKVAVQGADGSLCIGRQALRDALAGTREFAGVTGQLCCDVFGDCARPIFNVLRLDDSAAGVEGLQSNVLFTHGSRP